MSAYTIERQGPGVTGISTFTCTSAVQTSVSRGTGGKGEGGKEKKKCPTMKLIGLGEGMHKPVGNNHND